MAKRGPKSFSADKIVLILRDIEQQHAQGTTIEAAVLTHDISEQTYYRWKRQYGAMGTDEVKRLKELEKENARLKKLVANLNLDVDILKEALEGKY